MYRTAVDLNCDMGEGFGHWSYGEAPDDALMKIISSANVACGFHAGDPTIMDRMARMCAEHGVGLGTLRLVADHTKDEMRGSIVICPPSALNDRWSRRLPEPITAMASGSAAVSLGTPNAQLENG